MSWWQGDSRQWEQITFMNGYQFMRARQVLWQLYKSCKRIR